MSRWSHELTCKSIFCSRAISKWKLHVRITESQFIGTRISNHMFYYYNNHFIHVYCTKVLWLAGSKHTFLLHRQHQKISHAHAMLIYRIWGQYPKQFQYSNRNSFFSLSMVFGCQVNAYAGKITFHNTHTLDRSEICFQKGLCCEFTHVIKNSARTRRTHPDEVIHPWHFYVLIHIILQQIFSSGIKYVQ